MMKRRSIAVSLPLVLACATLSADTIKLDFRDSTAVDLVVDGTVELFRTASVAAGDATFNFDIQVTSAVANLDENGTSGFGIDTASSGADTNQFDLAGENVTFAVAISNFTSGGTTTMGDISFTAQLLEFSAANQSTDSGTVSSINGGVTSLTWQDMNGGSDFVGHVDGSGINLFVANGNSAVTEFGHDYAGGTWRIDSLTVEFSAVPEPTAGIFFLLSSIATLGYRRRVVKL